VAAQVDGLLSIDSVARSRSGAVSARLRPYKWTVSGAGVPVDNRLGGILADDMGLARRSRRWHGLPCRQADPTLAPFLVVAPPVRVQLGAEAARFAPDLAVVALSDTARRG